MFRCLVWLLCLATYLLHCTGGHVVVPMTNKQLTEKVQKLEDLPEKVDQLSAAVQSMLQRLDDAHPTVTRCPDGWISHQSSCYGIGSEGVTWGAAQEFCELLGGGLAEMDSDEENEFVKGIARSRGYRGMWLGATDAFSDGNWVWASSRRRVSRGFTDWHANERTQNGGGSSEDCLLLARSLNYRWADAPCNWAVQFVCEIRLR